MHVLLQSWWQNHNYEIYFSFLGLLFGGLITFLVLPVSSLDDSLYGHFTTQEEREILTMDVSQPIGLRIPSLAIETTFGETLGLDDVSQIEVPQRYHEVGWYEHGPTPGELGPAVVLGHVDSYTGPAVFYALRKIEEGALIYIDRADGSQAVFRVVTIEDVPQSAFPTQRVFSDINHAGLRLVTCTGTYDEGIQRYSHNLIVYAKLASTTDSGVKLEI